MKLPLLKTLGTFIVLSFAIISCTTNSGLGPFDEVVIDNPNNNVKFEQITFTVSFKNDTNGYLLVNKLDSLYLNVNAKQWGVFTSEEIDTTAREYQIIDNVKFSSSKVSYLIVAPYIVKTEGLETAGDFVRYLQDRIALSPGSYVCELESVCFSNEQGDKIKKVLQEYKELKIESNTASTFMGNIEITIN